MAYRNGPLAVTNGLIFSLDAADRNSYTGSGDGIWRDLSNTNNTISGSLINGPIFNSLNGGSIVFDGTNDQIQTNGTIVNVGNNWTVNIWFRTTGSSSIGSLFVRGNLGENFQCRWELQASTGKVNFLMRNTNDQSVLGVTSTNDNKWHMASYTNNAGLVQVYLDGRFENSGSITNLSESVISSNNVYLARLGQSTGPYYYNGYIALVQVYNRLLSIDEIKQNFEAYKSRFEI